MVFVTGDSMCRVKKFNIYSSTGVRKYKMCLILLISGLFLSVPLKYQTQNPVLTSL